MLSLPAWVPPASRRVCLYSREVFFLEVGKPWPRGQGPHGLGRASADFRVYVRAKSSAGRRAFGGFVAGLPHLICLQLAVRPKKSPAGELVAAGLKWNKRGPCSMGQDQASRTPRRASTYLWAAIASFGSLVSLHGGEDGAVVAVLVDQELGRAEDVEVGSQRNVWFSSVAPCNPVPVPPHLCISRSRHSSPR